MAIERVPAEVWQTILRYSISVPVFFDADPIESNGFEEYSKGCENDRIYWRSERHRNVLRRVCSGWNAYLIQFSHRFVQLEDVWTERIPATSLKQAIKLEYNIVPPGLVQKALKIVKDTLIESQGWALEILDGGQTQIDELILQSDKVPNLNCISYARRMKLPNIASWRPNTQFLIISLQDESTYEPLRLSCLTTLSIMFSSAKVVACDFPSLKHLSIHSSGDVELSSQDLVELLKVVGKNLVTLIDHFDPSEEKLPGEVWVHCPNLKRFQTSFAVEPDAYIPPSLEFFQISSGLFYLGITIDSSRLPTNCLRRAGITKVILRDAWERGLNVHPNETLECALRIMNDGLSFYDIRGMKFQDMIVILLQSRKANKRIPFPGWNQPACWF